MLQINKNDRFGRLRVVKELERHVSTSGHKFRKFKFKCDCGNKHEAVLSAVMAGRITSCGCYNREVITKHGYAGSKIYKVWQHMHERCYNKKCIAYPNYGARGIKIHSVWHGHDGLISFVQWSEVNGYNSKLEIDRIDNNKGYSPKNCRFVTTSVNGRNRRKTYKVLHPDTGKQISLRDLADEIALPELTYEVIHFRLEKCGYTLMQALKTPYKFKRSK